MNFPMWKIVTLDRFAWHLECNYLNAHEYNTWFLSMWKNHSNVTHHLSLSQTYWSFVVLTEFQYPKVTGAFLIAFMILPSPTASNAFISTCTVCHMTLDNDLQFHWLFQHSRTAPLNPAKVTIHNFSRRRIRMACETRSRRGRRYRYW